MSHDKTAYDKDSLLLGHKKAVKRDLYEQEHRLIPAVYNFFNVLCAEADDRKYFLPSVGKALFWCLLPSAGTASVGVLAILTLLVAVHQSRLLQSQNNKIEVQNILAEAERRSTLMFETVAIFEQIEKEKESLGDQSIFCDRDFPNGPCWIENSAASPQDIRPLFVPSLATVGRLAALTQALRPYRYLQVEGAEDGRCPSETASAALDSLYQSLLAEILVPWRSNNTVSLDDATTKANQIYAQFSAAALDEKHSALEALIQWAVGGESDIKASLNCGPSSPERGQLLVSLHAAGVDISAIERGGGNFTYADIPGANLTGIRLKGVNLNYARLPGASFSNADLFEVHFRGADLNGARFAGAKLSKVDFEGARLQIFEKPGDSPLYFLPNKVDDILISGIRVFEQTPKPNIIGRFCLSLKLPSAFALDSAKDNIAASTLKDLLFFDLSDYGLLVETVTSPESELSEQKATLMFGLGLGKVELFSSDRVRVEYFPMSYCK